MSHHKVSTSIVGLATAAMLLSAFPAAAQTTTTTSKSAATTAQRLAVVINRSNTDIAERIADLNKLNTRVQALKNESASEKSAIAATVQTNIAGLTALQSKIDADTDAKTARTDAQTIATSFRIYALIVPQGSILASADRVTTIGGLMTALGTKIQARVTVDQTAGKDVSAITAAMTDYTAKIADANSQAQTAQTGVVHLVPDQGNTATAASNKAALVAARANIKMATQDLQAARKDVTTMLQGLKALGSKGTTATSTATQ